MKNVDYDTEKLIPWLKRDKSTEQLQRAFLNMDLTMKYIHDNGYIINSFEDTDVVTDNYSEIESFRFNNILAINKKTEDQRKQFDEMKRENIYKATFLAIGIYTNCLEYLRPQSLKENFSSFAIFLPEEDVSYYKGVVERGASVYYSDYVRERKKRDLQTMQNAQDTAQKNGTSTSSSKGNSLVKSNGHSILAESYSIPYSTLYGEQMENKSAAFLRLYIFPALILTLTFLISLIICILALKQ